MSEMIYIAPCHFGLEAVLKREITDLGYRVTQVEDGRVKFAGDGFAAARANLNLRCTERVLLEVGEFKALSFDELFEETKKIPWEEYLPENAKFWVSKVSSIKSVLHSPSDVQSIMKKAMVERMKAHTGISWFPEDGASYPLRVAIRKDIVTVGLDTTGASLHKRGYRVSPVIAPISETLAASLIALTPWKPDRILVDPFCGSGTIPIEAAMIAKRIAPGMNRRFLAEEWGTVLPRGSFKKAREEAKSNVIQNPVRPDIQGYDIDDRAVRFARENAEAAGVAGLIHFQRRAVKDLSHPGKYGFIITNPPYGERLADREALPGLYKQIGEAYERLDSWSMYLISSYRNAERDIGRKASKNRKIYNGMLESYVYQYLGPKPPGRSGLEQHRGEHQ